MYTLHIPCFIVVLITFVECLSLYRPLPINPHLPIYPVKPVKPVKPKYPRNCPPVCLIFCPNGNVLDKNGCPTCKCIPDKPNADVCSLPKVVGPCKAAFPRYFYNKKTGRCEKFIYGGCGANENNFKTLTECQEKCDPCRLPKKVGPCEALIPRYFYNNKTRRCEKFFFGGCNANKNNFNTLQKCKETCENSRR